MKQVRNCEACHGKGQVLRGPEGYKSWEDCDDCGGSGQKEVEIETDIEKLLPAIERIADSLEILAELAQEVDERRTRGGL